MTNHLSQFSLAKRLFYVGLICSLQSYSHNSGNVILSLLNAKLYSEFQTERAITLFLQTTVSDRLQ